MIPCHTITPVVLPRSTVEFLRELAEFLSNPNLFAKPVGIASLSAEEWEEYRQTSLRT